MWRCGRWPVPPRWAYGNFLDAADLGVLLERAVLGYARVSVAAWAWLSGYLPDWIGVQHRQQAR